MKKATIVDVANACGVSMKTVSRVINNSPNVSEKTKKKVYAAMKDQGYQVNILAKGLKGNRTNIVVVFADRHHEEHLSVWHNIMLKYLFAYAKFKDMKVVLSPSNSTHFEKDSTDGFYLITSGIADGAILLETVDNDPRVEYFEKNRIPYVVFGESRNRDIPSVSLDNFDVGYNGGKFLVEKGYHKIAFFVGEERFLSTQLRLEGFQQAMDNMGAETYIFTGVDTVEKAYRKSVEVLEKYDIQAFFVSGDERALGVYRGIYESGLQIPEDIAVLGIDNIMLGSYYYPPISTVEQDFEQLAKSCLDFVVDEIENGRAPGGRKHLMLSSKIIERQST
ncbi:MAG: LacI family transcriptional regulator [Hespellia sp.]|jgi:DNA-binding LacI/PurR family transcriptional regulator|nr:LacI family transcriptional regulator [Hespellia sp.]